MRKRPRKKLIDQFGKIKNPKAKKLVEFMRMSDADGFLPCWGSVAKYCDKDFKTDEQRIAMWPAFLESDDWRAQLLFIHFCRSRPAVIEELLKDVDKLSVQIQRALVSMEEITDQIAPHLEKFHPAAQQLAEGGLEALERERQVIEAKISKLMSLRVFKPDVPAHHLREEPTETR